MFPWPVRVLGVALASTQLVVLAIRVFGVEFTPSFEDFMTQLQHHLVNVLYLDAIEAAIRDVLAWFAITLPELGKHWHSVFVLLWLLMGSWARLFARSTNAAVALVWLAWAGVCALVAAVVTGTAPLESEAMAWWPFAGFILFGAGVYLSDALRGRVGWLLMALALAAFVAFAGYAATPMKDPLGIVSSSPGLLVLVGFVGLSGLIIGALGMLRGSTWRERLTDPYAAFGADVIGSYAIAFTLAAMFGKYTMG